MLSCDVLSFSLHRTALYTQHHWARPSQKLKGCVEGMDEGGPPDPLHSLVHFCLLSIDTFSIPILLVQPLINISCLGLSLSLQLHYYTFTTLIPTKKKKIKKKKEEISNWDRESEGKGKPQQSDMVCQLRFNVRREKGDCLINIHFQIVCRNRLLDSLFVIWEYFFKTTF